MSPLNRAYRRINLLLATLGLGVFVFILTCSHSHTPMQTSESGDITHTTLTCGVKDVWLNQDGHRLQTRIASENSNVAFLPRGKEIEVIECMQNVSSWMQRKIYPESQQVRYLKADEATFLYHTQKFLTQNVALTLYNASGKTLSLDIPTRGILLKGVAKELSFKMGDGSPSELFATDFRAEVTSP